MGNSEADMLGTPIFSLIRNVNYLRCLVTFRLFFRDTERHLRLRLTLRVLPPINPECELLRIGANSAGVGEREGKGVNASKLGVATGVIGRRPRVGDGVRESSPYFTIPLVLNAACEKAFLANSLPTFFRMDPEADASF